ncbi:ABC transporter permease subunit [Brevibacillus formosus]|uniref:ABC transporter permease subunit n=1 Tax=Brevibacillus TaxID=55080 RepID=UPI000D0F5FA2|nr:MULTISPECIES: ABC transporter permease subunit [Brevibacillus]MBG9943743.1 glutathione ABC transporter permease [Brevibacillus formosus]MED1945245.1 ABC transporter permease subunit [Brevibacillus formosus]MED1998632.1 ABC transporter permease subunit [Brevibacillus formosus]MED2083601.1 ABC transporter permease subunit [Brevibacillus formosus]PSK20993.1 glutathione ABC transporter permease [Brevibacillus sp. NRRL NRS-603]
MEVVKEIGHNVVVPPEKKSRAREFWKKWKQQKTAFWAGFFILFLFIIALFGPWIAPYDPYEPNYDVTLQTPSIEHWAGTDEYGRDILSRIIVGTGISLGVSFSSVLVGAVVGTILGLISGYYGGWMDRLIMRWSDVMFAFPDLLLAIAIVAILGPGLTNVVVAVAVFSIPSFARLIRGNTLAAKEAVFVEAARSMGAKSSRIMFRHIFPETVSSMIVFFSMRIGTSILAASSLSFLGLGAAPESPDWGAMLSMGRDYLATSPHVVIIPGIAIFLTVLAFNLVGDGLRDILDPKTKN